jgi:hypothetical protein
MPASTITGTGLIARIPHRLLLRGDAVANACLAAVVVPAMDQLTRAASLSSPWPLIVLATVLACNAVACWVVAATTPPKRRALVWLAAVDVAFVLIVAGPVRACSGRTVARQHSESVSLTHPENTTTISERTATSEAKPAMSLPAQDVQGRDIRDLPRYPGSVRLEGNRREQDRARSLGLHHSQVPLSCETRHHPRVLPRRLRQG